MNINTYINSNNFQISWLFENTLCIPSKISRIHKEANSFIEAHCFKKSIIIFKISWMEETIHFFCLEQCIFVMKYFNVAFFY